MAIELKSGGSSRHGGESLHSLTDHVREHTSPDVKARAPIDLSRTRFVLVLTGLCLTVFLSSLDFTIISTAIPAITDEFGSIKDVGWYGSAFFITTAATQPPWGKFYQFFDLKWTYLTSIALFEVGSLICGVAPTSTSLIIGRAICGVGAAGLFSGSYTIISVLLSPDDRPKYSGLMGGAYGIASVVGPLIGGAFTSNATWRWCFYINLPVGGVSALMVLLFFVSQPTKPRPSWPRILVELDLIGVTLIIGGVTCFILALQWGGVSKAWNSSEVIGTLVGFGLMVIAFVVAEWWQGETAMLHPRVIRRRTIAVASLFGFLCNSAFLLTFYYLPIYFQSVQDSSAQTSGIKTIPYILAVTLCVIVSGQAVSKFGHYVPWMLLGAAITAIGSGLIYTFQVDSPAKVWIGYQILGGIGVGLSFQVPIMVTQSTTHEDDIPLATAAVLFLQTLGGAFSVSAAQAAFQNTLLKQLPITAPNIDPMSIINAGATELKNIVPAESLNGVLQAYLAGFQETLIVAMAFGSAAFVSAFGFRFITLQRTREVEGQN